MWGEVEFEEEAEGEVKRMGGGVGVGRWEDRRRRRVWGRVASARGRITRIHVTSRRGGGKRKRTGGSDNAGEKEEK